MPAPSRVSAKHQNTPRRCTEARN
ncbi:hypothetical protein CJF31_00002246 [Rutstroemia sp. NJR-2017a BVV2]|nr:hypothetical protein CJF31_00002246 [Rutstroemia sp. NJR-2017a BVV2]